MKTTILTLFFLFIFSCDTNNEPEKTYEEFINDGWLKFEEKRFNEAVTDFTKAKELEPEKPDSYIGIGWSELLLSDFTKSLSGFDTGISKSSAEADLFAGKAFLLNLRHNDKNDLTASTDNIRLALNLKADWVFDHGLKLTKKALHFIEAQNYFYQGDKANCLNILKTLNPSFEINRSLKDTEEEQLLKEMEKYNPNIL